MQASRLQRDLPQTNKQAVSVSTCVRVCARAASSRLQVDLVQDVHHDGQVLHGDGGFQSFLQTETAFEPSATFTKRNMQNQIQQIFPEF